MKLTSSLFVIPCLFLCLQGRAQADTLNRETVFIRIIESGSYGLLNNVDSRMIVAGPGNRLVTKDLQRANYGINANQGIEFNTRTIQSELQSWHKQGFEVKGMGTAAAKENVIVTTYVLQKD